MRTILRRLTDGSYFEGPSRWTGNPRRALNFKSIDRALQFIEQWHLEDVEIAFAFTDRKEVTGVPLERVALRFTQD